MIKAIVITAPSGAGKTTIANMLRHHLSILEFSISSTTRSPRGEEKNGREYFFIAINEFKNMIAKDELFEWQEVYPGKFYGTPKSEIDRITQNGKIAILDINALGAINVKNILGDDVLTVFIEPPTPKLEVLENRLRGRNTESEEQIKVRLDKAKAELELADQFDLVVVNDDLDIAFKKILDHVLSAINESLPGSQKESFF